MKKLTILIFMIVSLWACDKDGDKPNPEYSIVGTWWHYETFLPASEDTFNYRKENYILFVNTDGYYETYENGVNMDWGKYKASGTKIILYEENGELYDGLDLEIIRLDEDYLDIKGTYTFDGTVDTRIYRYRRILE